VSEGTNSNLSARNTLAQLLALYTDRGGLRKRRHIEPTEYTKDLESHSEIILSLGSLISRRGLRITV